MPNNPKPSINQQLKKRNIATTGNTLGVHSELISNEIRFLIACCQTDPSEEDTEFILSYLSTPSLSPSTITTMASRHGILPLVYKTLKKLQPVISDPIGDPDTGSIDSQTDNTITIHYHYHSLVTELKPYYMSIVQRNMLMTSELIKIMDLLRKNSIEALAFKGPALAQMVYEDITLRQYSDLDVLTRKENIYKIDSLLKAYGYKRLLTLTPIQEKVWIKYAHDMGFIHKQKGVHFEMHWSFLDEDYPLQVDLEDFWKETHEVKLNGHPIPTFSNENLLYYLCIHGSKHLWERIEWVKDLDLLIQNENIDWDALTSKAEVSGFEKMVYLGLSLSASLFATPLPQTVQEKIAKYPQLSSLSDFVLESWQTPKSTFEQTSAMIKLFPGIKEQLIYLHKVILKPSFNEYWYVDLPKRFYWGYYLVRPYLLIKKYFSRSV